MRLPQLLTPLLLSLTLTLATQVQAQVNSVFVQSTLDYNAILISGVDVLFLYDDSLLDELPSTKAQWFANKEEFLRLAAESADLVSVFIPQGFDSEMLTLPQRREQATSVFAFAQHDISDRAPIELSAMHNVLIEINQFGIAVTSRE